MQLFVWAREVALRVIVLLKTPHHVLRNSSMLGQVLTTIIEHLLQ